MEEVLIFYNEEDEEWYQALEKQLIASLQQTKRVSIWTPYQIPAGEERQKVIDYRLNTASIILLLISANFLASNTNCDEMQRAMQCYEANGTSVIPILLKSVDNLQNTLIGELQALPRDGKPLAERDLSTQDKALADIVKEIRQLVEKIKTPSVRSSETTFPRFWNIPFQQNPLFTGCEEVLTRLAEVLGEDRTVILSHPQAISGLGGIGKTQIAIQYAYRYHRRYQYVLWAYADTYESLVSSYMAIAHLLNLPQKDAGEQEVIIEAVKRWLFTHEKWLLIFDNATELPFVKKFLPLRCDKGHILFTTRSQAVGGYTQRIEVNTMDQETGALLLLQRAHLATHDAVTSVDDMMLAKHISEELGGLPLALVQAGAYIEETRCGLEGYLRLYKMQRATLLKYRDKFNEDYPESVATTWSLSFEKIEQANPIAADLLRLCAFLHPDDIPGELITEGAAYLGPYLMSLSKDPFAFDEAIATLGAYSLLRRTASSNTLSIHRLVQAVILDEMSEAARQNWTERVVCVIDAIFPQDVTFEMWTQCERYLVHTLSCAALIEQRNFMSVEAASLLNRLGWYLRDRAKFGEAEQWLKKALAFGEKVLGREHPVTRQSINELARLYFQQGRYKETELLYRQALAISLKEPLRPTRLTALNNLADTCRKLEKNEEALILFQQALSIYPLLYEDEHPVKAMILSNLGLFYLQRKEYEKAELPLQQALAIRKKLLRPEDPEIAISLNTLAGLYRRRGQDEKAEPLLQQALKIDENAYGNEHPEVAADLNELAELYRIHGEYAKAEPLYQRALAICETWLVSQHELLAVILNNLGLLYLKQEKYEQAKPLLQQSLAIREEQLGLAHLDTAITLNNLGLLYSAQERYEEAEALYMRALAIKARLDVPNHSSMAQSLNNLGQVYYRQEKYAEAESLYLQALEIREKQLGPDHPDTAESLTNLALLRWDQGKRDEAESMLRRALSILEHRFGTGHPHTVQIMEVLQGMRILSRKKNVFQHQPSQKVYQRETARRKSKSKMAKQSRKKNRGR